MTLVGYVELEEGASWLEGRRKSNRSKPVLISFQPCEVETDGEVHPSSHGEKSKPSRRLVSVWERREAEETKEKKNVSSLLKVASSSSPSPVASPFFGELHERGRESRPYQKECELAIL